MDERLKQKLELLGEPTLPDSLTAEELFRRMDSGELVLPEEIEVEAEAAPSEKVIPWAKVLRRGLPIAACLALVVFIAQGRFWRMGSSGGANLTSNADAPQAAAADQTEPMEKYSLDGEAETPEPFRSIAIEEDDQEAEVTKGAADEDVFDDVAEEDTSGAVANAKDEPLRPDSGGDDLRPDSGWDESDKANPDSGPVVNPDIGPADYDREQAQRFDFAPLLEEIGSQLYLQDEALTGLTPFLTSYGPMYTMTPDSPDPFNGWFYFENDEGKVAALRVIHCSINQEADGAYSLTLLSFEEWDRERREEWLPGMYLEWADVLS